MLNLNATVYAVDVAVKFVWLLQDQEVGERFQVERGPPFSGTPWSFAERCFLAWNWVPTFLRPGSGSRVSASSSQYVGAVDFLGEIEMLDNFQVSS